MAPDTGGRFQVGSSFDGHSDVGARRRGVRARAGLRQCLRPLGLAAAQFEGRLMTLEFWVGGVIAVGLLVYLIHALLYAERF